MLLSASPLSGAALAGEFDLLAEGTPTSYILDDASVLNKTTKKTVTDQLKALEVGGSRPVLAQAQAQACTLLKAATSLWSRTCKNE